MYVLLKNATTLALGYETDEAFIYVGTIEGVRPSEPAGTEWTEVTRHDQIPQMLRNINYWSKPWNECIARAWYGLGRHKLAPLPHKPRWFETMGLPWQIQEGILEEEQRVKKLGPKARARERLSDPGHTLSEQANLIIDWSLLPDD